MIRERIRAKAYALGFDTVGFTRTFLSGQLRTNLAAFLAEGRQGGMGWLATERRADPRKLWPEALSVIVLGLSYAPTGDPLALLRQPCCGSISVYARNRDYHDVLRTRLKVLGRWMHATLATEAKVFVDSAPLLEKPLAQAAGLGWQGRHTNLVSRRFGSWLFLGEVLTSLALPPDPPHPTYCGSCRRCRDACPTGAITADGQIDARCCISYLTIEHKAPVPIALRPRLGNRIYGCDDCLAVCPWNRFATPTVVADFQLCPTYSAPTLADLATLDADTFAKRFRGSPLQRIGCHQLVRNVLLAIGNSGTPALATPALARLQDSSPLVRGAAVWALSRLLDCERFTALRTRYLSSELDGVVQAEWTQNKTGLRCQGHVETSFTPRRNLAHSEPWGAE